MTVQHSVELGVAHLLLDRPHRRNAIDTAMADSFESAVTSARAAGADIAVLRASSPVFCSGNDLDDLGPSDVAHAPATRVVDCMTGSDLFWVTVIEGPAVGGALSLAAVSHIVLASTQARFALPEAGLGLFPSAIFGHLEQVIGPRQAFLASMTGESFDAEQARVLGLVSEVVDPAYLEGRITEWTQRLRDSAALLTAATRAWSDKFTGIEGQPRQRRLEALLDEQFQDFSPRRP